ncbi:hypothetical protein EK21DRAFT_95080 [Setomelanomma holmii]|uniref:Uncharacterized protein n=1 Tax=Setomelanomma holmii TaxID=210430 RepID=A0A9P4GUN2_9PLEO|nr:hypothetical protein EK21DRAFT_95080 [Setomelanomma holmii]
MSTQAFAHTAHVWFYSLLVLQDKWTAIGIATGFSFISGFMMSWTSSTSLFIMTTICGSFVAYYTEPSQLMGSTFMLGFSRVVFYGQQRQQTSVVSPLGRCGWMELLFGNMGVPSGRIGPSVLHHRHNALPKGSRS